MNNIILLCEPTPEGILTGVYEAYERKCSPNNTHIQLGELENYELFAEYISVHADSEKAWKVGRTIRKKFSDITTQFIWYALYSYEKERGDAIYHTIARGLAGAFKGELIDFLQDPYISKVAKMRQNVWCESHHYMGFVRFQELKSGILYSEIEPKNHVLPLLGDHFSDRFPKENFMIRDKKRNIYLLHETGKDFYLFQGNGEAQEVSSDMYSAEESKIQNLFKTFCKSIAIEARENKILQQQMLPLRFQQDMVEFPKRGNPKDF